MGDGSSTDSLGRVIFDPYPTEQSAGFDLDAVGVIHARLDTRAAPPTAGPAVTWRALRNRAYQLQWAENLVGTHWVNVQEEVRGDGAVHVLVDTNTTRTAGFYRVLEALP